MPIIKVKNKDGKNIKINGLQKYHVRINYTNSLGKPKQIQRTAYGIESAKEIEQKLINSVNNETITENMTVQQLYDDYIESKEHEVRETSIDKTKTVLTLHVLPILRKYKLDKLSIRVLENWKREIEKKGLKIRTRRNIYSEFRTMLNYAVKMEYIPKNPLTKVGNFKAPLEIKEEMKFYTPEEFQKFIKEAKKYAEVSENSGSLYEWNYYVFFCIAFYMGMRKGEIYALQWTDIKEDNLLSITKSLNQKMEGNNLVTAPKNASSIRTIEIPKPLVVVLNEHKKRCQQFENYSESNYICGGKRPVRDSTVQNMNKKFAEEAGVKHIRLHDFRHSHASLLANEGINIQEIARRLGHTNTEITLKTYSHLYPRESERAIGVLDNLNI